MEDMQIVYLSPHDLKPYENNTRKHNPDDIDGIKKSILAVGFRDPIGIWGKENLIVEGHGRQIAAIELGIERVPCIRLDDMTEDQRKEYAIRHNRTAELSSWDFGKLEEELAALELQGIDMSDLDFDLDVLGGGGMDEFDITEDEPPEPPATATAKRGDIWQLGRHRLMCGDSTVIDEVKMLMGGEMADMLVTDPPYNVNYEGKTKNRLKIENDNQTDGSFRQFLVDAFTAADAVMKPGAVFYIWHSDSEGYNFRGACRDCGWTVRQCLIWNKNSMIMGRQDYQWKHEPCLYGWKDGAGHLWASDRKQTTVIDFNKPIKNDIHPTMKPVGLFDYQIRNNTKGNDTVLDLFGGSGTTIVACEQDGRKCFTMELDPRYVDAIIQRWENLTGQKAVLVNG